MRCGVVECKLLVGFLLGVPDVRLFAGSLRSAIFDMHTRNSCSCGSQLSYSHLQSLYYTCSTTHWVVTQSPCVARALVVHVAHGRDIQAITFETWHDNWTHASWLEKWTTFLGYLTVAPGGENICKTILNNGFADGRVEPGLGFRNGNELYYR